MILAAAIRCHIRDRRIVTIAAAENLFSLSLDFAAPKPCPLREIRGASGVRLTARRNALEMRYKEKFIFDRRAAFG